MSAVGPEDVHIRFAEAFNRGDIETLLALYEPSAVLHLGPDQSYSGPEAIRAALGQFLALNGTITMALQKVCAVGDLALVINSWSVTGAGPDGPITLCGNATDVLRRQADGSWLVAIDNPYGVA